MALHSTQELISALAAGEMIVLMDDEDRENEGDLIMAAECVDAEAVNFMVREARGLLCLTLTQEHCQRLGLTPMASNNQSTHGTNFTVSIEARSGIATGISAADRAHTIRTAVATNASARDLVQPGHVFPIAAVEGGVLTRAGHTEASVDLARLAGRQPAAAIIEIMTDDGSMARRPQLEVFAAEHGLKIGTIADLIAYRCKHEQTVRRVDDLGVLKTDWGDWQVCVYADLSGNQHLALHKGQLAQGAPAVRVHLVEPLKDLLRLQQVAQGHWSFARAMAELARHDNAAMVLLSIQKPLGLAAITERTDTNEPTSYQSIGVGSQILRDLGISAMRLLSNPASFTALSGFGLEIESFVTPR